MIEAFKFLFSENINAYLQSFGNPFIDALFKAITYAGSQPVYFLVSSLIFWCYSKKTGIRAMYVVLLSAFLAIFAKNLFGMARPPESLHKLRAEGLGFGFPSAHAQVSAGFWGYLGGRINDARLVLVGTAAILLVSLSRVYLGVHYAGDVAGGILFGLLIALVALKTESGITVKLQGLGSRSKYAAAILFPAILIAAATVQRGLLREQGEIGLIMASTGMGYLLQEEYVGLEEAKNNRQRIERAITGISLLLLVYLSVHLISRLFYNMIFFEYAALGMTSTFIAPWIFGRMEIQKGSMLK